MKVWLYAIIGLLVLSAGCKTDPRITALERENRDLEDEIYELDDLAKRYQWELDSARKEIASLRTGQTASPAPTKLSSPPATNTPAAPVDPNSLRLPSVEVPSSSAPAGQLPESLRRRSPSNQNPTQNTAPGRLPSPGSLDPPDGAKAPARLPNQNRPPVLQDPGASYSRYPRRNYAQLAPPRRNYAQPAVRTVAAVAADRNLDNNQVAAITLNRTLTSGFKREGNGPDDGIRMVIEPRDAQGRLLPAVAPISVVVLDSQLPEEQARVARWDLTAEQVSTTYQNIPAGEGFFLELPWPEELPAHERLHLFIRYTTRDGRKLESRAELDIELKPNPQWSPVTRVGHTAPAEDEEASPRGPGLAPLDKPANLQSPSASEEKRSSGSSSLQRPVWSPTR